MIHHDHLTRQIGVLGIFGEASDAAGPFPSGFALAASSTQLSYESIAQAYGDAMLSASPTCIPSLIRKSS